MKLLTAPDCRRAFAYLGTIVLCLAFIACDTDDPITPEPPEPEPDTTVADVIEDRTDLSDFYDALLANNLVGELADAEDVTVFAPDNDAFAAADLAEADTQAVLEYHIVDGTFTEADLQDGVTLETWQGGEIEVTVDEEGNVMLNGAQVTESDLEADNGVVHVIDQVLEPEDVDIPDEGTVVDVIEEHADLTTMHTAIMTADLETDLRTADAVTVFAPNDDAFEDVNIDELTEEELRNTLEFHIVDSTYTAADLQDGMTLETWQGGEIEVTVDEEGNVMLNGAQVIESDLEADNGVVHVIDEVLEAPDPNDVPDQTVLDVIAEEEDLSEFYQAIQDAGLEEDLAEFDELTVFAPENDAFDEVDLGELEDDEIRDLLLNHFAEGTFTSDQLEDGDTITTLADGELEVTIENGTVFVDGATVIEADLEADDGVVHIIDTVLPSPNGNGNGN